MTDLGICLQNNNKGTCIQTIIKALTFKTIIMTETLGICAQKNNNKSDFSTEAHLCLRFPEYFFSSLFRDREFLSRDLEMTNFIISRSQVAKATNCNSQHSVKLKLTSLWSCCLIICSAL